MEFTNAASFLFQAKNTLRMLTYNALACNKQIPIYEYTAHRKGHGSLNVLKDLARGKLFMLSDSHSNDRSLTLERWYLADRAADGNKSVPVWITYKRGVCREYNFR